MLASVTAPVAVGDPDSIVVSLADAGTHALVAVRTNGDSRVSTVTAAGVAAPLGTDFGLNGTDIDTETIEILDGALLHVRTESGMLQIRKLCR